MIVSYRVPDLTIDCLRSLSLEIGRVKGTRVALCENGTGGDAADRLRRAIEESGWGSWVDLTVIYPNRGFTGGNNAVIRPALESDDPPEYVLLLNADTLVKEHALDSLVAFMDSHPAAGIAGSQLLFSDATVGPSAFRFQGIATELDSGLRLGIVSRLLSRWSALLPPFAKACPVDWVPGTSMILRRTMLEQIGLLDEGLYTYFDDPDICLRAHRAGWEVWCIPESRVIHFGGASTGLTDGRVRSRLPAYWYQGRRRFFLKNYGPWRAMLIDGAFILGFAAWRLRRRIQRKPDTDPPRMLFDSIRHSVFCTGFRVTEVENPAMPKAGAGSLAPEAAVGEPRN